MEMFTFRRDQIVVAVCYNKAIYAYYTYFTYCHETETGSLATGFVHAGFLPTRMECYGGVILGRKRGAKRRCFGEHSHRTS